MVSTPFGAGDVLPALLVPESWIGAGELGGLTLAADTISNNFTTLLMPLTPDAAVPAI